MYVYNVQPGITIDYSTERQCFPIRMRQQVQGKNQWKYREKDVCVE